MGVPLLNIFSSVKFPLLSERLSIESLCIEDLGTFLSYRQHPDIARFQSWDPGYSEAQARDLIDSQFGIAFPEKGEWLQLAIHVLDSGHHVSDLALHALETDFEFELGFTVAKNRQGKGFAKEAASTLIGYLFNQHEAKRIVATPDARNSASKGLLSSLGFIADPSRSWQEEFKGEFVTVEFFEMHNPRVA
jgi:RimJ/RimL family protein N-acetyltransferase